MKARALTALGVMGLVVSTAGQPLGAAAGGAAGPAEAAVTRDELLEVAAEVARLRAEVASLREELAAARGSGPGGEAVRVASAAFAARASLPQAPVPAPDQASLEMLQAQVEELAQTRVETESRMPVRLFGALVANTVSNSGAANWLENPNLVDAPAPGTTAGSFTSTLRQSQIGLGIGPLPVGAFTAHGTVLADFLGGAPGFVTGSVMGLPRLVVAFARLERGGTAIQIGQDHNLLSPRNPTSIAAQTFPLLFRAGNLYLRSPQVRVEQTIGGLRLGGGIAAPLAADLGGFAFAPPAGVGERSRRPAFEGRADYTLGGADAAAEFTLGVAGRYGWRRPGTELEPAASWAADFNARVGRVGAAGEFFYTDDGAEFGSAVGQPRPAAGGWVEGRLRLTPTVSANGGVGLDRVRGTLWPGVREENRSVFGNVIFDLTPEVAVSMEYRWLETRLSGARARRDNHHVNAAFVVRF